MPIKMKPTFRMFTLADPVFMFDESYSQMVFIFKVFICSESREIRLYLKFKLRSPK